jgi:hypothetical protein
MTERLEFESWQVQEFSLFHVAQTGSGAHPAFNPMGTEALSLGVKRPGSEGDYSPPISAEVKNGDSTTPLYAFMTQCLIS